MIDDVCRTLAFLRSHGIVHFDAHVWNIVGDGNAAFLTDFGLALDAGFELTHGERAFLGRHWCYDYGEVIASVGLLLLGMLHAMAPEERARLESKYGLAPGAGPHQALSALLARIEDLHGDGDLPLDTEFVEMAARYRAVILFMSRFLSELQRNRRKDTRYDDDVLRRLLEAAAFPYEL